MSTNVMVVTAGGEHIRVVVVGDVLALPDEQWAKGGFGASISVEWLLSVGCLPGSRARQRVLAEVLVQALAHSRRATASEPVAKPCSVMVHCGVCGGNGWVPAAPAERRGA